MTKPLPRFVIPKLLASGLTGFYFNINKYYASAAVPFPMSRWALVTSWRAVKTATVAGLRP